MRLHSEVVQSVDGEHQTGDVGGDGRIAGVGEVLFAVHVVVMDLSRECIFDLSDIAGEGDGIAAPGDVDRGHVLAFEPGNDGGDIGRGGAEAVGVLFRGQPLVVVGGSGVLLLFEEGVQIGLLLRGWFEEDRNMLEGEGGVSAAEIVGGNCAGVHVARQGDAAGILRESDRAAEKYEMRQWTRP